MTSVQMTMDLLSQDIGFHSNIIRILAALILKFMKMRFVLFFTIIHWFKIPAFNGFVVVFSVGIVSIVIGDEENEAPPIN